MARDVRIPHHPSRLVDGLPCQEEEGKALHRGVVPWKAMVVVISWKNNRKTETERNRNTLL